MSSKHNILLLLFLWPATASAQFEDHRGLRSDVLEAVSETREAELGSLSASAQEGAVLAQIEMGRRLRFGIGVAIDYLRAAYWYERAASQLAARDSYDNNPYPGINVVDDALLPLACMHFEGGFGLSADPVAALGWLRVRIGGYPESIDMEDPSFDERSWDCHGTPDWLESMAAWTVLTEALSRHSIAQAEQWSREWCAANRTGCLERPRGF